MDIINWFIANPWASFIGLFLTGILLRAAKVKGYGE